MNLTRRLFLKLTPLLFWRTSSSSVIGAEPEAALPFGDAYPQLDSLATGEWWKAELPTTKKGALPPSMDVARDEVVAFALYTHDHGVLKLTAQFFPLKPGEARQARLEFHREGVWAEVATEPIHYANPPDINDERQRADGYGIVRFDKQSRQITFECWPRFSDAKDAGKSQFPGWPITISMENNDGRKVAGWLPELVFENGANPVVQVIEDATEEVLYTVRTQGGHFHPRVYSTGKHTIKLGADKPNAQSLAGLESKPKAESGQRIVKL